MAESQPQFKYRNITISGLPGCGSTTLLRLLRDNQLMQDSGWRGFSGGEFMRAYAIEKGKFDPSTGHHHSAADYDDDFDRQVDMGMRQKLEEEEHWILESWLSGFLGQQVPGIFKILMTCSDDSVRIDRIMNRDNVSVDEAKNNIHERYQSNFTKWQRMYSDKWQEWVVEPGTVPAHDPIAFWRPELYDIVIDTYKINQQETLTTVLNAITKQNTRPLPE